MFTAPLTLIAFRFLCCLCLIFVYTPRGTAVVLLLNSILLRSSYLFYGCIYSMYYTINYIVYSNYKYSYVASRMLRTRDTDNTPSQCDVTTLKSYNIGASDDIPRASSSYRPAAAHLSSKAYSVLKSQIRSGTSTFAPYFASSFSKSSASDQRTPPTIAPPTLVGGPPTTRATRSSTLASSAGACFR